MMRRKSRIRYSHFIEIVINVNTFGNIILLLKLMLVLTAFREIADLGTGHEACYTRHSFEAIVGSPVVNRMCGTTCI
jgi:hypothetical protein